MGKTTSGPLAYIMSALLPGIVVRQEMEALRKDNGELKAFVMERVDAGQYASGSTYTGNAYKTFDAIITEMTKKYEGKSDWGVVQLGNIVDIRAAFIIGQGVTVGPADKSKAKDEDTIKALEFARAFISYNDIDREGAQEFAKEAELEGCWLGLLEWHKGDQQVQLRYMSRAETKYVVATEGRDYAWYRRVDWADKGSPKTLAEPAFVYARFGGRVHKINEPIPKVGKCLTEIEALSKALRDWREINRLFGSPVPHITCATADDARAMSADVEAKAKNFKLRKLLIHTGTMGYLTPDPASQQGIENEITMLAKMISGATGVPVHFLGLPDLLSNRATADNLLELVAASTQKERMIWAGTYQQLIEKAAAIWNKESGLTVIRPELVKVSIPAVSAADLAALADVWLPLYNGGGLSLQTFLEKVPGVDASEEAGRIAAEKDENAKRFNLTRPDGGDGNDN